MSRNFKKKISQAVSNISQSGHTAWNPHLISFRLFHFSALLQNIMKIKNINNSLVSV